MRACWLAWCKMQSVVKNLHILRQPRLKARRPKSRATPSVSRVCFAEAKKDNVMPHCKTALVWLQYWQMTVQISTGPHSECDPSLVWPGLLERHVRVAVAEPLPPCKVCASNHCTTGVAVWRVNWHPRACHGHELITHGLCTLVWRNLLQLTKCINDCFSELNLQHEILFPCQHRKMTIIRDADGINFSPVSRWRVEKRIVRSLYFVIHNRWTGFGRKTNKIFSDNDKGYTSAADVLLSATVNDTELKRTNFVNC